MKPLEFEEGLIKKYLDQIGHLGVKASEGTDVRAEVEAVVQNAAAHFAGIKSSTELGNLRAFAGRLAIFAEGIHPSQPVYRETLELAKTTAEKILKGREKESKQS